MTQLICATPVCLFPFCIAIRMNEIPDHTQYDRHSSAKTQNGTPTGLKVVLLFPTFPTFLPCSYFFPTFF